MLNIYTERKNLNNRQIIHNIDEYFDNEIVYEISQKNYTLSEQDRMCLSNEDWILSISNTTIQTIYGELSLSDIPLYAKAIITIRYLDHKSIKCILNISNVQDRINEIMIEAEKHGIDLLILFSSTNIQYNDIDIIARFNDSYIKSVSDYAKNSLCVDSSCVETSLTFADKNNSFNLIFNGNSSTVRVKNKGQLISILHAFENSLSRKNINAKIYNDILSTGEIIDNDRIYLINADTISIQDAKHFLKKIKKSSLPIILIVTITNNMCKDFDSWIYDFDIYNNDNIVILKIFNNYISFADYELVENMIIGNTPVENQVKFTLKCNNNTLDFDTLDFDTLDFDTFSIE